jgi:hypothetical protein
MKNAKVLGAYDKTPLLDPFVEAMGIEKRTKEEILADPDVHAVLIHPKSYLMADWAIEAMEAGSARSPPAADRSTPCGSSRRWRGPASSSRSATAGATRPRSIGCRRC